MNKPNWDTISSVYGNVQNEQIKNHLGKLNEKSEAIRQGQEEANRISLDVADSARESAQAQRSLVNATREQTAVLYDQLEEERLKTVLMDAEYRRSMANDSLARKKEEIERLIKESNSYLRDTLFQAGQKAEVFLNSQDHNLEKFFQIKELKSLMNNSIITTAIADSFEEKEYINNTIKNIDESLYKVSADLSDQEIEDLHLIHKILEVDEDAVILERAAELKKEKKVQKDLETQLGELERNIIKSEKDIEKTDKEINNLLKRGPYS